MVESPDIRTIEEEKIWTTKITTHFAHRQIITNRDEEWEEYEEWVASAATP